MARLRLLPRWSRLVQDRLSVRLSTTVLALAVVCLSLLSWFRFRTEERALDEQIDGIGNFTARTVAWLCADLIVTEDNRTLEDFADFLLHERGVQLAFVRIERDDGKVLNIRNAPTLAQLSSPDAKLFSAPVLLRPHPDDEGRAHRQQQPLLKGVCHIGLDLAPWSRLLRERAIALLLQNLLAFGFATAMLMLMLRAWVSRPLQQLETAATRIGGGDLELQVPQCGVGELGRLAASLEQMRQHLRTSHASLAEQNTRLLELDRLKDEFLANMSHEIRTPLSSILGSAELLADAPTGDRADMLDALRRNAKHLLYLVNQVLDFSKLQSNNFTVEPQDTTLRPLFDDLVACMRPQSSEKHLHLYLWWREGMPETVRTDSLRLRQILMNLIGNAIKFTQQGGVDVIVDLRTGERGPTLEVVVADTGIGIPPDQQARLFQPFNQGDASMTRRFGGTGLGLVISRRLAQALGGDLELQSTVDVGTRIRMTLPLGIAVAQQPQLGELRLVPIPQQSIESAPPVAATTQQLHGRILLVDDAADNRKLLTTMLRKAGLAVETAENGQIAVDAVTKAKTDGAPFDLVLLDIQMPVLDGYGAAARMRHDGFAQPIVALTAHATEQDRERCRAAGFDDYATKPISRSQLTDLVRRHLAARA